MLAPAYEQLMQARLIRGAQAAKQQLQPRAMACQHLVDELPAARSEAERLAAEIAAGRAAHDQAGALKAIDHAGDARRADEQSFAQVGQSESVRIFHLRAMQRAKNPPLRSADPEAGE